MADAQPYTHDELIAVARDWASTQSSQGELVRRFIATLAAAEADKIAAAGELLVDMAEAAPGTLVGRLLIANRLMRNQRDEACTRLRAERAAAQDVANEGNYEPGEATPAQMLKFLLVRIGSWTSARWDQHLRFEFGDDATNRFIEWLKPLGLVQEKKDKDLYVILDEMGVLREAETDEQPPSV
jgi:hypothetical protein